MKSRLLVLAALAVSLSAFCEAPKVKKTLADMSPEERKEHMEKHKEMVYKLTGGKIVDYSKMKGKISVINTQAKVPADEVKAIIPYLKEEFLVNCDFYDEKPGAPAALKAKAEATFAVIVVENDGPVLLSAIEDGWCVVNVNGCVGNLKTEEARKKFLASRCRKEILRGLVSIAGGLRSSFPGNIMVAAKADDLDLCNEMIPYDRVAECIKFMKAAGMRPKKVTTYKKACEEGWAPAPTNDVQKAVWDKVHELPAEPIKIKPEAKKVAE